MTRTYQQAARLMKQAQKARARFYRKIKAALSQVWDPINWTSRDGKHTIEHSALTFEFESTWDGKKSVPSTKKLYVYAIVEDKVGPREFGQINGYEWHCTLPTALLNSGSIDELVMYFQEHGENVGDKKGKD